MDSIQRAHVEHLLQINRAHLRELETQQAKLGVLAPSGIAVQIDEYQHTIIDLERQLAEAPPRHNLPPCDYERFVGRQHQLEEVRRLLLPDPTKAIVTTRHRIDVAYPVRLLGMPQAEARLARLAEPHVE